MSLPATLQPHTVVVVRPAGTTDADNNTVLDYGAAASRTTITGRLIQQTATQRYAEGRDSAVEGWTLLTNTIDIVATDRIEWASHPSRGAVVLAVEGPPMPRHDDSTQHHTRVPLRIYSG